MAKQIVNVTQTTSQLQATVSNSGASAKSAAQAAMTSIRVGVLSLQQSSGGALQNEIQQLASEIAAISASLS